jgi:Rrf2 family protein
MKITRETDHAIKCILYLCIQQYECISVAELSEKLNIPRQFLAKIVQKLSKAGLLESQQGKQGGFRLTSHPSEINLYDVFIAIQSVPVVNSCVVDNHFCERTSFCAVHNVWMDVQADIIKKLKETDFMTLSRNEFESLRKLQTK